VKKIIIFALLLFSCAPDRPLLPAEVAQQSAPEVVAHPQANGDTCYTYLSALDCLSPIGTPVGPQPTVSPTLVTPTAHPTGVPTLSPSATATLEPTETRQTPLPITLNNGGFESGAQFWAAYVVRGSPEFNSERLSNGADPRAVLSGDASWRIACVECGVWRAGLFQRVRVGVGRAVTFSANAFFKAGHVPGLEENLIRNLPSEFRMGIDPAGGQSATAPGVVWSSTTGDFGWKLATVSAIATGDSLTVFIETSIGSDWIYPQSYTFIDDAELR